MSAASRRSTRPPRPALLPKARTGIAGFDEITEGGLPRGRPTLVSGGPGCGKTLFGVEFLVHGAETNEPGVLMTFEETADDVIRNARSLGYRLDELVARKRLAIEYVKVDRAEIEETGEYDLEALFIRLNDAIRRVGAKRVMLDTIESLFGGLANVGVLRAELRRLFGWLKTQRITAVITGEGGTDQLTRQGLEEYVSDCVIALDHRVADQISTRRLRIVKYRGSSHGTNEYPFLIDRDGIAVAPITSLQLVHAASSKRVSTGLDWLDRMYGGQGFYRGSSIMISGGAGSAKTSLASHFVDAACRRGERAACFLFEESPSQYCRNMESIGLDMQRWVKRGLLKLYAARPTFYGLEFHLASMHRDIERFNPAIVVVDPLSSFSGGPTNEVNGMMMRLIDYLKQHGVTAMFTNLISGHDLATETTHVGVSSLMDTWMTLRRGRPRDGGGRFLSIVKSRGMAHEAGEQPFMLTDSGAAPVAASHQPGRVAGGR